MHPRAPPVVVAMVPRSRAAGRDVVVAGAVVAVAVAAVVVAAIRSPIIG